MPCKKPPLVMQLKPDLDQTVVKFEFIYLNALDPAFQEVVQVNEKSFIFAADEWDIPDRHIDLFVNLAQ
jgi:hypothetical protein